MIAFAGCRRLLAEQQQHSLEILAQPRWPMNELR
jgi:tRNA A37 threonylcarbamoyltransferase TsaD